MRMSGKKRQFYSRSASVFIFIPQKVAGFEISISFPGLATLTLILHSSHHHLNIVPMEIQIKKVGSRKELKKFIKFPFVLYKNDPCWVPPLISAEIEELTPNRNPAFEHCEAILLLAYKNGNLAGRIAGIINHRYIELWKDKIGRFCWFDFIDDYEVSAALLKAVEEWASEKGMDKLMGPMGFTTFERQGILVEGFDKVPTIASSFNHPYYAAHLEHHGYLKDHDYVEFLIRVPDRLPEKSDQLADLVSERYHLHPLKTNSKKVLMKYSHSLFDVINAAYSPLHGFVPLTDKQVGFFLKKFNALVSPDFISVVRDENDVVVGFQIAIPSLSRAFRKAKGKLFPFGFIHILKAIYKPERVDLMLVGIRPEYQNKGVSAFFMNEITRTCIRKKIPYGESNGMLEENFKVLQFMKYYDAAPQKRRRLFFKFLAKNSK